MPSRRLSGESFAGRVLLVEPNDAVRAAYREGLTSIPCDVVEAVDGRDALAKAFVRPPSLVISELALPKLDGFALCEILRRDSTTCDVPLLIVTAERDAATLERARRIADSVIVKPASVVAILQAVARLVQRSGDTTARSKTLGAHAAALVEHSKQLVKSHRRFFTITPPLPPPQLQCSSCLGPLEYEQSYVGGVNARLREQWDYYICRRESARYQYRQRTRKLRRVSE